MPDLRISSRYAEQEDHDEPHLTNGRADWVALEVHGMHVELNIHDWKVPWTLVCIL